MYFNNKNQCVILIPIYKSFLNEEEICSINQCQKILGIYDIFFLAPKSIQTLFYKSHFPDIGFYFFENYYFEDIKNYSKLLISYEFYKTFNEFEYMLIYQTDAWVFEDQLAYWCSQSYDYIGAPSVEMNELGEVVFLQMFNGGFSLRNINSCLRVLTSFAYITPPKEIVSIRFKMKQNLFKFLKNIIGFLLDLTIRNNVFYKFNSFYWHEDGFWSNLAPTKFKWFAVPSIHIAAGFAFENEPEYILNINDGKLPFGCHGWTRYHSEFYMKIINRAESN